MQSKSIKADLMALGIVYESTKGGEDITCQVQLMFVNAPTIQKWLRFFIIGLHMHIYINSRPFPMGVGRNHRTPPATTLTYSFCLVHVHTSGHTSTPVTSTTHPTFLKNLTNKVRVGLSRASPPGVATHICHINPFCKSPFTHPLNMTEPSKHTLFHFCHLHPLLNRNVLVNNWFGTLYVQSPVIFSPFICTF